MNRSIFHRLFKKLKKSVKKSVKIPIKQIEKTVELPIRRIPSSKPNYNCISVTFLEALGGANNIRTYREIPNSNRIRLTLVNPKLLDEEKINQLKLRMYLRVGDDIIHIIQ